MKYIESESLSNEIREFIALANEEPIILVRNGKPILAVYGIDHEDQDSFMLGQNEELIKYLSDIYQRRNVEGGFSLEEMKRLCEDEEKAEN